MIPVHVSPRNAMPNDVTRPYDEPLPALQYVNHVTQRPSISFDRTSPDEPLYSAL